MEAIIAFPVHHIINNHASKNKAEEQLRMTLNSNLGPPRMYPYTYVHTYMHTCIQMHATHAHIKIRNLFLIYKRI